APRATPRPRSTAALPPAAASSLPPRRRLTCDRAADQRNTYFACPGRPVYRRELPPAAAGAWTPKLASAMIPAAAVREAGPMPPTDPLFAKDYKGEPFWWEATPRPQLPENVLPARADAVVIGSGYTGLSAALQTARGGRHTVVLDAEDAGWGCSSRNGGQVSTSIKPSYDELAALYGPERAFRILKEGHNALAWLG